MDFSKKITVVGGDLRQIYIYEHLKKLGFSDCILLSAEQPDEKDLANAAKASDAVIAPVPVVRYEKSLRIAEMLSNGQIFAAGKIPDELKASCKDKGCICYDYMDSSELADKNAVLTAEGTICEIIKNTKCTINNSSSLILGFGRCGSRIAELLIRLGGNVTAVDNSEEAFLRAEISGAVCRKSAEGLCLSDFDFVVNTVDDNILNSDDLGSLSKECLIFDISSAAKIDSDKVIKLPGLPGKYSPKTAGILIAENVINNIF